MISQLVDGIRDAYLAACESGEPRPSFGLGAPAAAEYKSLPSIVFVPMSEKIEAAKKHGGGSGAIALRHVTCQARIWGKDIDDCENLAGRLVDAVRTSISGYGIEFADAAWDTSGKIQKGQVFVMAFVFQIELVRRPDTTAEITTAPITGEIEELEIGP